MDGILIENFKTAKFKEVDLCKIFDPQTAHQKSFTLKNAVVSSPHETDGKLYVTFYTLMPGQTNFPYHYHSGMEEVFYIISGTATLKTPDGDKQVTAGDVIVMPNHASGAHQLTNTSDGILVYLDIDTQSSPEVVFFPDKGDFRIFTPTASKSFPLDAEVNYLRNE
jgi:uncharacterized cupin superfamily protein